MKLTSQSLLAASLLISSPTKAAEVFNFDIAERSCVAHDESNQGYYGQLSWHGKYETLLRPLPRRILTLKSRR